jgi:hypothetical protein
MDKVTRYEWHGNWILLVLFSVFIFTIPIAVIYFFSNLLKIETAVSDSEKLSDFLNLRK